MATSKEQMEQYTNALETWLNTTLLPTPVKRILAEALTEISIPILHKKRMDAYREIVKAKKVELRKGTIDLRQYNTWLSENPQPRQHDEEL